MPFRGKFLTDTTYGSGEINSNFMQLLYYCEKYVPELVDWLKKPQDRFTSPEIQNEIIEIMAMTVLRKLAADILNKQYTIMVDETTDISNVEQLVFCLRFVDEQLHVHESCIGFHSLETTSAESIVKTIEDILLRLSLQVDKCRGQCYDGAAAMAGHKSGVATAILSKEPCALYSHCYGHALNLAVQDMMKGNKILRDTLDTVEEMTKLIKKSPKRQAIFKKIQHEIICESPGIRMLAPTRWTVRAEALTSISENYEALRDTWYVSIEESKDSVMRARIGGVARQMDSTLVLNLAAKCYAWLTILSKTLQAPTISATEGQGVMKMTLEALKCTRSDEAFSLFWKSVEQKRQQLDVDEPRQPRQRKVPRRYEVGESIPTHHKSVSDTYKLIYYEVIDYVVQAITTRKVTRYFQVWKPCSVMRMLTLVSLEMY